MYKLSHCCHRNMEGKSSHICELADMYLHHNNNLVDCSHTLKGLSFDFIKVLTKHGSLQTLGGGLGLACVARVRLAKMALCGPHRPHRPRHTRPRHQPRQRRQRLGGRAAATQPSASEKEKMHPFFMFQVLSEVFREVHLKTWNRHFNFSGCTVLLRIRLWGPVAESQILTCLKESEDVTACRMSS